MSKELFIKLCEKLERDPTDDEMADEMSRLIDGMDGTEKYENYSETFK